MSPRQTRSPAPDTENFYQAVVEAIRIQHDGQVLDYESYLALPEDHRSNDEAAVVDQKFTRNL